MKSPEQRMREVGGTTYRPHKQEEKQQRNGTEARRHGGIDPQLANGARHPGEGAAAGTAPSSETDPRAAICVTRGKRHEAADAGLAALTVASVPFFQRDRSLVRVCAIKAKASDGSLVTVPAVTSVTLPMLGRALGQASRWERVNHKRGCVQIDPPREVVEQIGAMVGEWPFPPLYGVIGTATLRPDGSLLATEGYDPITGFFLFAPPVMPPIPPEPTRYDALNALALLNGLLTEFPFANKASRSVAMSMLLTPVLRGALTPAVPLHVVTAPEAGTGKSYLQDIASCIAVGDRCAALSLAKKDPSETEKRLIGAAKAQQPIIALDNISELMMGDFLCQVTERPLLQVRPLSTSNLMRIANTFTVFANGNNLTVSADVVRRTIQCALDACMEVPEEREFTANPVAMVLADRGRYVAAALTVARAYIVAGRPGRLPRLPSYEGWSDTLRSALVWLGWPDPVDTVANVRVQDPIRQARAAVFSAWAAELQLGIGYQTGELIRLVEQYSGTVRAHPALWDALFAVAASRSGHQMIDPRLLGLWLRDNLDTIAAGHKLTADRSDTSRPRWKLDP
jgi:putative DNA primase/helicase